jgi:hypothetical protein
MVIEFPEVCCPAMVNVGLDKGTIPAENIPRGAYLELEAIKFYLEVVTNNIGLS